MTLARTLAATVLALASMLSARVATAQSSCEDAALSELAAAHALDHLSVSELLARARREGASHPSLHVITLADDDLTGRAAWLRTLASRGLGPLVCGEALTETSRVVVAAPAQGTLAIDGHRLRVTLAPRFAEPVVYVRSGSDEPRAYGVHEGVADVDLGTVEAPAQLQLVATGPEGPRPVAELRVGEGVVESGLPEDARVIDFLRDRGGVGPLRPNRLLEEVAQEHAEHVCASGHVAHEIADEGDAERRLRRAHVEARHVGEVVARAEDQRHAWRALTASPSHRAALGDRRFTDVGIGTAEHDGHRCLVVLLAAWPRRVAR
ncbi:MAG: CAP domain-containing protein [Sandaracinus sp.]